MIGDREHWLARTLIELADTLADDFDLAELLHRLLERCVELLGAAEAGIVLTNDEGRLQAVASTSEGMHVLELLEVQNEEGPCLDSYLTGAAIRNAPLDGERWPAFAERARAGGFRRVHAMPLRHGGLTVGALNVFHADGGASSDADLDIAQSLADMATISVLHHRALSHAVTVAGQLQRALHSRVAIEQAKGVVAERLHIDIDAAFGLLRGFARRTNEHIADVAALVLAGRVPVEQLVREARALDVRRRSPRPTGDGT
jgi:GAF domain-containing protein